MKKAWQILEPDIHSVENLCRILNCHRVIASILVNRNIFSPEDASNFLNTSLSHLGPPFTIKDMDAAVERIITGIMDKEKILIFGDYDVDGITATTILLEFLRSLGVQVSYYIPHRTTEGFGLKKHHILDHALPNGIDLIITVDCGSDSHEAVEAARQAGIDVIITDHHIISDILPPAVAVVNPKRCDCPSGFHDLAGVGVVLFLLVCLRKKLRNINFWQGRSEPNLKSYCDLVALGTLADMVPLTHENRILARTGLDIIGRTHRPGLKALMGICNTNKHAVDTDDMVFGLAPRLNSAGRMDHASISLELLTTTDVKTAEKIATSLDHMNQNRRRMENKILIQVHDRLQKNSHLLRKSTLVLAQEGWHLGVLGIVASRLTKKYFRPVVLITTSDGIGIGSARSIPGVDLYKGLSACANDFENFGGHAMAAGLKIKAKNIERFEINFENTIGRISKPDDFIPKIIINAVLNFEDISDKLIDELEFLKPFGMGNSEPLFMARNIDVVSSTMVGNHHRRMVLSQRTGRTEKTFNSIHFNVDPGTPLKEKFDKIAFRLRWNRWNGRKTAQLVIEEA